MLESMIEKRLTREVEKIGGKSYKFTSPSNNGVPDRIVLKDGQVYFVELKREGKTLRPLQKAVKRQFKRLGFEVYVIDSYESVDKFIKEMC